MEPPQFSPQELASLDKAKMAPELIVEVQEHYALSYLAAMRRLDFNRNRAKMRRAAEEAVAERERQLAAINKPWSNGPCVYCEKDDGKTEIRSMGPIHLVGCFARHTTTQRKKVMRTIQSAIGAIVLMALTAAPAAAAQTPNETPRLQALADAGHFTACGSGNEHGCVAFMKVFLKEANPTCNPQGWGLLSKSPGEHQCDGVSCDAMIFGRTQQVVDIVQGSSEPGARLGWLPVDKRPGNQWVCTASGPDPEPEPDPAPDPDPELPADTIGAFLIKIAATLEEIRDGLATMRAGQEAQTSALKAAIADLQAQVKAGVKIKF
jgi:hypothetical protein